MRMSKENCEKFEREKLVAVDELQHAVIKMQIMEKDLAAQVANNEQLVSDVKALNKNKKSLMEALEKEKDGREVCMTVLLWGKTISKCGDFCVSNYHKLPQVCAVGMLCLSH